MTGWPQIAKMTHSHTYSSCDQPLVMQDNADRSWTQMLMVCDVKKTDCELLERNAHLALCIHGFITLDGIQKTSRAETDLC